MQKYMIILVLLCVLFLNCVCASDLDNNTISDVDNNNITDSIENQNSNSYNNENADNQNLVASASSSTTYYVNSNSGSDSNTGTSGNPLKTIQKALTLTNSNDKIYLYNGNYAISTSHTIEYNLEITGESTSSTIIKFSANAPITLRNSVFTIQKVKIINSVGTSGGVFKTASNTKFTAKNVHFENNTGNMGGVLYNEASSNTLIFNNCTFIKNKALQRSGVINNCGSGTVCNITNSKFINNTITDTGTNTNYGCGGAIYNGGDATLNVKTSLFENNTALRGAAIYNAGTAKFNISSSNFTKNIVTGTESRGGAISVGGNGGNITTSRFINNSAFNGGAISINSGQPVNVTSCAFIRNQAGNNSGAIYDYGNLTVKNCNFSSNTAVSRGGATFNIGTNDNIVIMNSQFSDNTATTTSSCGGAISGNARNAKYTLKNNTFTHNTAKYGGALYSTGSGIFWNVTNCTFTRNVAQSFGSAFYTVSPTSAFYFTKSKFYNGVSGKWGGALGLNGSNSQYTISENTFENNLVSGYGGTLYVADGSISCSHNYFKNNSAIADGSAKPGYGGVIYANKTMGLQTIYNYFFNNNAVTGGAIYLASSYTPTDDLYNYAKGSNFYNNTNKTIYSNVYFNATYNWWGSNNGNNTANSAISNNNVDLKYPVVFRAAVNTAYNGTHTTITSYFDLSHYNNSGELKLVDHDIKELNMTFNLKVKTTNQVLTTSTKTFNNKITVINKYSGNYVNNILLTATIQNQTYTIDNDKETYLIFNNINGTKNTPVTIQAYAKNFFDNPVSGTSYFAIKINGVTVSVTNLFNPTAPASTQTKTTNGSIYVSYFIPNNLDSGTYTVTIVFVHFYNSTSGQSTRSEITRKLTVLAPAGTTTTNNNLEIEETIDATENKDIEYNTEETPTNIDYEEDIFIDEEALIDYELEMNKRFQEFDYEMEQFTLENENIISYI